MRPHIIAHRGFHQKGIQENSVQAMQSANDVADGVEFDVRQTKDGVLVLAHDPVMYGRPIAKTPYVILKAEFERRSQAMTTLVEALAVIDPEKLIVAEVKVAGIEQQVAWLCQARVGHNFRIASFHYRHIAGVPIEQRWMIVVHAIQARPYRQRIAGVDFRFGIWWVKRWGLEVSAWGLNTTSVARRSAQQGVQYITTDEPESIRKAVSH